MGAKRFGLALGLGLCLLAATASSARADIWVYTKVELYQDNALRGIRGGTPGRYADLYGWSQDYVQIATTVKGNALEQIISAASLASNLYAMVTSGGLNSVFAGMKAYNDFNDLMNAWGGRARYGEEEFIVQYPHPLYNKVKIIFDAYSEDDPFLDPAYAPASRSSIGLTRTVPFVETETSGHDFNGRWYKHRVRVTYTLNLTTMRNAVGSAQFWKDIPFTFAIREDPEHTSVSNLRVAHALTLKIRRREEVPPLVTTNVDYMDGVGITNEGIGTPVLSYGAMSFAPWLSAAQPGFGDSFQTATVFVQKVGSRFVIGSKTYNYVQLQFRVESNRIYNATRPPMQVYGGTTSSTGPVPAFLQPVVLPVSRGSARDSAGRTYTTEGWGAARVAFYASQVPTGTYDLYFNADQLPGGWTCTHHVRLVVTNGTAGGTHHN